jgi:two-component system, LuxR family, sensor kinase FixL
MRRDPSSSASPRPGMHFGISEAHQRSILSTVPDAMIVIDAVGTILSFSTAAQRMFDYRERDVLGENVRMLMPSPDRDRHDDYLARYLRTGEPHIIGIGRVTTARRRDGSSFPIELSVGDAETPDGRVFTGFIRDLTERRNTERRLRDLQSELSHMTRISAMGTLASALAHELNQPLTAIANYLEAARDLLETPDAASVDLVREAMTEAAEQSIRAGQIVRRLREFIARGESEKRVESLRKLVTEANALALINAGDSGLAVEVTLEPGCDSVLVDRIQIQQVLLNLIRNAIEAMQGSTTRRLEIIGRGDRRGFIHMIVADSGPGLSPERARNLFEPFRSSKAKGMGLGLSICRTIIEAHGGRIWAKPSHLGGTSFHFTVMAAALDGESDAAALPDDAGEGQVGV